MHLRKYLEKEAYISYMTRVIGQVEFREEYKAGKTPLCFVGDPENLVYPPKGFDVYSDVTGMEDGLLLGYTNRQRYEMMFDYLLGLPVVLADEAVWNALQESEAVTQMPCYPDTGCIRMIDDTLVVKLGD